MQLPAIYCVVLFYSLLTCQANASRSKTACLLLSKEHYEACTLALESWSRGQTVSSMVIDRGYLNKRLRSHAQRPPKIDEVMNCFNNANQRYLSCKTL